MNKVILVFSSTHYAVRAEKIIRQNKIDFEVIPAPREISSDCGMALKFNRKDLAELHKIIENASIKIENIYSKEQNQWNMIY